MADEDAARAFEAINLLAAHPGQAVSWLREWVRPTPAPNARQAARWIADLDSDKFAAREKASHELEKLGELAEPELRKALAARPSLEVRRRVEKLLERLMRAPMSARLREVRAVEALERMGTPEARRLLEALAGGAAAAPQTREAKASLRRLNHR